MNILAFLLVFALLTTALYGLSSALLRWLHTPLRTTDNVRKPKQSNAEPPRSAHAMSLHQDAALHALTK